MLGKNRFFHWDLIFVNKRIASSVDKNKSRLVYNIHFNNNNRQKCLHVAFVSESYSENEIETPIAQYLDRKLIRLS